MKFLTDRRYPFTTIAETGIVCNVKEELFCMSFDYDTELESTSESSTRVTPMSSQTETTSLSTLNVSVTRKFFLPVSLAFKPLNPGHFFPKQQEVLRELPQRVTRQCCVA